MSADVYDGLAMAETMKCPNCGAENESGARKCGKCQYDLKSELECLRSIDVAVGIIKRILIWWVFVSFVVAAVFLASGDGEELRKGGSGSSV